jgi:hypothetical protein
VWFRVDDKLHDHHKARAAGKAAMGVWVLAGSWAGDNLTDGFIPASVLTRWGSLADARRLVQVGFWIPDEQNGETGWRFHDWEDRQPTKAEVESKREAARTRMARHRKSPTHTPRAATVRANSEGTSQPVREPRPDPTRPAAAAATREALDTAPTATGTTLPPPLPDSIEILRSRLETRRLTVRWDKLGPDRIAQIEALIELHGDGPLVDTALRNYRADDPPVFAQAWLPAWLALPAPGTRLAAVPDPACTQPGHSGTTRTCAQCAGDRKAAR